MSIKTEYKCHPLMVMTFLKPYIFILIIPTAQGIFNYLTGGGFTSLIVGESVTAGIILALSIIKFLRCRMVISDRFITVRQGVLLIRESVIPIGKISSTFVKTGPFLHLCGAVEVRLNTEAGRSGKSDFRMIMPKAVAPRLYELFPTGDGASVKIKTPASRLIVMAAATSNSATGLLLAAPVINHTGKLLGQGITQKVYSTITGAVEYAGSLAGDIIPPAAGYLALILLVGFGVSFAVSVFKNLPFTIHRRGDRISTAAGTILRRRTGFSINQINSVSIVQNPVMMLLRRYNVKVCVAGYGDSKGETAMVIPAAANDEVYDLAGGVFPGMKKRRLELRHPRRALSKFCTVPVLILILLPISAVVICGLFKYFSGLIWFLTFVAEFLTATFLIISLNRFRRGGLTIGDNFVALGLRFFSISELHCKAEKIGAVRICIYPWDRKSGLCSVRLTVRSESAERLTVPALDYDSVAEKVLDEYLIKI